MGDTRTPQCLDPFLLTAVMVYDCGKGSRDAEEDEPVARRQFGLDVGEACGGSMLAEGSTVVKREYSTHILEGRIAFSGFGRRGSGHCDVQLRFLGGGGVDSADMRVQSRLRIFLRLCAKT